ncbi:MAG: ATP-grasp domain-containing protein [Proteobacteria bacterium]|nr:ATP-grasp domain-containing protein [Pseudomonadota bacterium]
MRNVIFAAPFPLETTMRFARAASRLPDVRLLGVMQTLPTGADARMFADVVQVEDGLDTDQLRQAAEILIGRHGKIHRLIGILEPLQVQLAEVRRDLGIVGTRPETADLFRDKARMKDELRKHGLPCARHKLIRTWADAEAFVAEVGLPIVLKPTAGMGCKATWRIKNLDELRAALRSLHASPTHPAMAEEFLRGREYSFETITINGEVLFQSCSRYYPSPLEVVETPWIQWVVVLPRVIDDADHNDARALGVKAVKALGLETGFTHMEWFRREDGSLAIGEIAARPPGANIVLANSYAHDTDMYLAWARAVVDDKFDGPWERKYAVGIAFLRGVGHGRVVRVDGIEEASAKVGHLVVESRLPARGAMRSDSYEGDGYVIVRDPDVEKVKAAMQTVIETVSVEYG